MENTIADLKLVEVLINSDLSAYQIEAKTGVTRQTISNLRTGKASVEKLELMTAIKLTKFSKNQIRINSTDLLNRMKHSNAFEYDIRLDSEGKHLLTDSFTGNRQGIYNYKTDEGHFYGVYGDLIGGQVDSRKNTDEEILLAIEKMLSVGNLIPKK